MPAGQRQAVYLPRIELRRDIDWTISGYRTLAEIGSLPWAAIAKRGDEIVRKARSFRKLITKDAAGQWWAREELPEIAAHLDGIEADVRRLNEGQPVSRDTETSALDWFVQRLTDVFEKHFKAKASRASGASGDEYYSPFVAFVIAVAEEAKIDIKPKTIHRIMAARLSMSRRVRKNSSPAHETAPGISHLILLDIRQERDPWVSKEEKTPPISPSKLSTASSRQPVFSVVM